MDNVVEFQSKNAINVIACAFYPRWIYYPRITSAARQYIVITTDDLPKVFLKADNDFYVIDSSVHKKNYTNIITIEGLDDYIIKTSKKTLLCSEGESKKIKDPYIDNLIAIINDFRIVELENNKKFRFEKNGNSYLNVAYFEKYIIDSNCIVGYKNNVVTVFSYLEEKKEFSYNLPSTRKSIILSSNYVFCYDNEDYQVLDFDANDKFEKVTTSMINSSIIDMMDNYEHEYYFNIEMDSNKLETFLNLCSFLPNNAYIRLYFFLAKQKEHYYSGDGVILGFYDTVVSQFYSKYLIADNSFSEFNMKEINKLSDNELINLGHMIHIILINAERYSFYYPISFLASILDREPRNRELSYFIYSRDPILWKNLELIKDSPEELENSGYENYSSCLRKLCKYEGRNNKIDLIAKGFNFIEIQNFDAFNFPTLDLYLSQEPIIDRDLLISRISISESRDSIIKDFKDKFIKFISNISEEELKNLLRNWTGSCKITKGDYKISIYKDCLSDIGIKFSTCSREIRIKTRMIKDHFESLFDILKTPYSNILD